MGRRIPMLSAQPGALLSVSCASECGAEMNEQSKGFLQGSLLKLFQAYKGKFILWACLITKPSPKNGRCFPFGFPVQEQNTTPKRAPRHDIRVGPISQPIVFAEKDTSAGFATGSRQERRLILVFRPFLPFA